MKREYYQENSEGNLELVNIKPKKIKLETTIVVVNHINYIYQGNIGNEFLVRKELPDGTKEFYQGTKSNEKLIRKELPDGTKEFYQGTKSNEKLVRKELPDGTKEFYQGTKSNEKLVRKELPDGTKEFYQGTKSNEKLVRKELPDGVIEIIEENEIKEEDLCCFCLEKKKNMLLFLVDISVFVKIVVKKIQ